jgi:hypothetical protein
VRGERRRERWEGEVGVTCLRVCASKIFGFVVFWLACFRVFVFSISFLN